MKFSEMKYIRTDMENIIELYDKIENSIKNANSFEEVDNALLAHEKLFSEFRTMRNIVLIRNSIDTRDEYYEKENEFYDENLPMFTEQVNKVMKLLVDSRFLPELKEKYGELFFKNIEMELKAFSPEIVPELQRENKLISSYAKLVASAQIDFNGEILTVSQLDKYKQDNDRNIRRAAYVAEGNFYMSHSQELDDIYSELVKCRTQIAHKLGFKSFTQVGYLRMQRNCYTPEMVKKFRDMVKTDLVPVVNEIKQAQADRLGLDSLSFYDNTAIFKDGNPKPVGTSEETLAAGKKMYHEMSPICGEFIDFMYDNELLDVLSKPGKAVGGYCEDLPAYKSPFIFSNFNGTSEDVEVITHEAGHAYASYTAMRNSRISLVEQLNPSNESCECHSTSMEFFAWKWLDLFYGKNTQRAKLAHMSGNLTFVPYGCIVDEFQHIVYDNPEMSPEERNKAWLELEKQYRPHINFEDIPFYSEGRGWQRQLHIYHYPFYYIDYCLAQTVSLYFWAMSQHDYANAWKKYNDFVEQGGLMSFTQLCEVAGIESPFHDGVLAEIAKTVHEWMENEAVK